MINNFSQETVIETTSQLPIATKDSLGVVIPRNNLTIDAEGHLDAGDINKLQSNWDETDPLSSQYIQNKIIALSQLVNDEAFISSITGLISQGANITITGTGTPGDPYIISASGAGGGGITQLIGDVLAGPGTGSQPAALSATGVSAGTFGDSTHVARVTVDAKGRVTSISAVAISALGGITQLTGDATAGPGSGSQVITLGNVNANPGLHGDATHVPRFNTDAKGRILSVTDVPITGGSGITQLTGDVTAGPGAGSQPSTLVLTGITPGPYGDSTHIPVITFDAKGRALVASQVSIPGVSGTSFPTTEQLGVLHNGTDQTAAINAILANANYNGLIVDFLGGGAITLNGAINANNKTILFYPGSSFTGTGVMNQAVVQGINWRQKMFSTTFSLNSCRTGTTAFSPMWYGATANGVTDDIVALQKTSDMMILNTGMTRLLYMPQGSYKTTAPWILYKLSGGEYIAWNLNILGEEETQDSNDSSNPIIKPTFKDTFAIGIQRAAGGFIKGIAIESPITIGVTQTAFYQTDWTGLATGARDSQFSPYAGIVYEPFCGASVIPPDGGYPGLTSWYQGSAVRSGTTDHHIFQCRIQGFTVDVMNTPNGYTQQGEDCTIEHCSFNYCNQAVAYGNTQTDHTALIDTRAWYYIYTVVGNKYYGNPNVGGTIGRIQGFNVAGVVKSLFDINIAQKNLSVKDIYCENLYEIGNLESVHAEISVDAMHCNFAYLPIRPQYHATLNNVHILSSNFKYFDDQYNKSFYYAGGYQVTFDTCYFDRAPLLVNPYSQYSTPKYANCLCFDANVVRPCTIGYHNSSIAIANDSNNVPAVYGDFKIQDFSGLDSSDIRNNGNQVVPSGTITYQYNNSTFYRYLRSVAVGVTITPDPTLRTATFTSSLVAQIKLYDYCLDATTGFVLGRITDITGTTITISEIPDNISTGTYTIDITFYLTIDRAFVGDTTSGSNQITNFVPLFNSPYVSIGFRIEHPAFAMGTYITGYNNTTKIVTVSTNANITLTRQNFANGNPQVFVRSLKTPAVVGGGYIFGFLGGTTWIEMPNTLATSSPSAPTIWYFNKGGSLSGATYYGNIADYNRKMEIALRGGVLQYFDTYTDSWINV